MLLSVFSIPSRGQAAADLGRSTGSPSTIYYGTNIDKVDTSSGNLHLSLPLLNLPGRGLETSIVLNYNSKFWQTIYIPSSDPGVLPPQALINLDSSGSLGWHIGVPRMGYAITSEADECLSYDFNGTCVSDIAHGSFYGDDGTHLSLVQQNSDGSLTGAVPMWTFDGSFALLTSRGLIYKDGVTASNVGTQLPPTGETLTDSNGNMITCSYTIAGGVSTPTGCIDTLGRQIGFSFPSASSSGTMTYTDSSGTTRTITLQYTSYTLKYPFTDSGQTFCFLRNPNDSFGPAKLLTSLTLPNGLSYTFQYLINPDGSSTGELTKIVLPTGGYIRYVYGFGDVTTDAQLNGCGYFRQNGQNRIVANRIVSADGSAASEQTWSYSAIQLQDVSSTKAMTVTDPFGNSTTYSRAWGVALPYRIDFKNASGNLLKSTQGIVERPSPPAQGPLYYYYTSAVISNPRYQALTTTLSDTNQQSQATFTYDSLNSITEKDETDWGTGAPGPVLRKNTFAYLHGTNSAYAADPVHILDRVASQTTCNAAGTFCAQTAMTYDGTTPTTTSNVVHHDYTAFPSSYNLRGNPTQLQKKLNTTGAWLPTTNVFNDLGDLIQTTDPLGQTTAFDYTDNFYNYAPPSPTLAFITKTTYPTTSGVAHIARQQYYFDPGLLSASCGQNFPLASPCAFGLGPPQADYTTYTYDLLNRRLVLGWGDGGQNIFSYNEASTPITMTSTTKINSTTNLVSQTVYDGLGRIIQTQLTSDPDCSSSDKTDTTYDALGRVSTVSNPYCTTSDPTYGVTTYAYDALGRKTKVIPPDGSTSANNITTTYSGNCTTVTDQAAKARKACRDGLGRLMQVFEDPSVSNYETDYTYDALDNLTSVVQNGSRQRTFSYDSLSRLTSATNPESGTITYTYNNGGMLIAKTAPAPNQTGSATVTTTYSYDALNRLTQRSYSDGTPSAFFAYDGTGWWGVTQTNTVGRLMEEWTGQPCCGTTAEIFSYDPMGRILLNTQYTAAMSYRPMNYTYDLAGNMVSFTDGVGETYTQTFSGTSQITQLNSSWVDSQHPAIMASGISYSPVGAVTKMNYGNGLTEADVYNNRLQPCRLNVNSSGTSLVNCSDTIPGGNFLDLAYGFNSGTANNGNVASWSAVGQQAFNRSYTYDPLNRIATMADSNTGQSCRGLSWTIDPWGNRTDQSVTAGTCNTFHQAVDTNNRLLGAPYQYDAAGNMTNDGAHTYTYDAEDRLIQVDGGATATYLYDAQGRRVQKSAAAAQTQYIYDLNGNVISELDQNLTWKNVYLRLNGKLFAQYTIGSPRTQFVHVDHLGSTRLLTDMTQSVVDSLDYLPFGEQIAGDTGTTHKFTGKERDSESGLDHFQFRNFTSNLGRWMSPDPINLTAKRLVNPANTLNKYIYGGNNPLFYVDPTGQDITVFYRAPSGSRDFGHVLLAVTNQATGATRFADYYPKNGNKESFLPVPGGLHDLSSDRLKGHAALTIKTNPEVAQKVIDAIDAVSKQTPDYWLGTSTCATLCSDLLNLAGIDTPSTLATPTDVWSFLYGNYSAEALEGGQLKMGLYRYQPGKDFGSSMGVFPRGTDPFWNLQLLYLLADQQRQQQQKPPRACTTIQGPNGPETHCVD